MNTSSIFCVHCGAANQANHTFYFACGKQLTSSQNTIYATGTGLLAASSVLKQRYHILRAVGAGGMGAVYVAEDTQLGNRRVAVKEMSQSNLSYPNEILDAAESFKQEAHLLAGLQHPNLPNIYDHFQEATRWYLVMSFIEGETLEKYLSNAMNGKLPVHEVLNIGITLCLVLDYLHMHKPPIIFRDLKPANIMRTPEGDIYLIDFGIARHFKPGQAKDTANYGSAGYAAPEQYGHSQTTPRSDVYSLGATLYQLLTGYSPSNSPFRLPPLQTQNLTLPPALVTLITQMLDINDNNRPASMKIVRQTLEQVLHNASNTSNVVPPTVYVSQPSPLYTPSSNNVLPPTVVTNPTSQQVTQAILSERNPYAQWGQLKINGGSKRWFNPVNGSSNTETSITFKDKGRSVVGLPERAMLTIKSDFVLQAVVTFLPDAKGPTDFCGGVYFRADLRSRVPSYYYFCLYGQNTFTVDFVRGENKLRLASGTAQVTIDKPILMGVMVQDDILDFYLDHQPVAHVKDTSSIQGTLGVAIGNKDKDYNTKACFRDLKLWIKPITR